MKSDRELLELAARAAGIPGRFVEKTPLDGYPRYSCGIGKDYQLALLWNPLECDGDALRLAVKLQLELTVFRDHVTAFSATGWCDELNFDDPYDATRRAIVRAAAAIGEAME